MPPDLDILSVFAHPDDAELLAGGSLARSVELGERVGILDLTRGEMGSKGDAETREKEANQAAEVLGVALRRNAGLPDARLDSSHDSRLKLAALIRELRPAVVLTHWVEGRHPDHRAAARLVLDACFLSGLRNLNATGAPFRPHKVVHASSFREDAPPPTFVIDVSGQADRKLRALECYASQFEGVRAAGEVLPGGDRPLFDQVRVHMAYWGSRIRAEYGEPFWTRETVEIPSLGSLPVSTF